MATNTYKAIALAYAIQEELAQRLGPAGANISSGVSDVKFDTDGCPYIQMGPGTANAKGGVVKIQAYSWPNAKDILGNTAFQYTPHEILLGTETNATANTDYNTAVELVAILGTLLSRGTRVRWYKTAQNTAPAVSGGLNGTLTATFDPITQYPLLANQ